MIRALLILLVLPGAVSAEILVASRTIRPQTLIGPGDVISREGDQPGMLSDPSQAVGQEARVAIYAGRPIRRGDVGPPALVERNQIVTIVYAANGLRMTAEARALDRAGLGERLRVMNLSSRTTVFGAVTPEGTVLVSESQP